MAGVLLLAESVRSLTRASVPLHLSLSMAWLDFPHSIWLHFKNEHPIGVRRARVAFLWPSLWSHSVTSTIFRFVKAIARAHLVSRGKAYRSYHFVRGMSGSCLKNVWNGRYNCSQIWKIQCATISKLVSYWEFQVWFSPTPVYGILKIRIRNGASIVTIP